jgi:hypothetical protein
LKDMSHHWRLSVKRIFMHHRKRSSVYSRCFSYSRCKLFFHWIKSDRVPLPTLQFQSLLASSFFQSSFS